ncbi:MAG: AraC family transcriptional regulator [Planctomycetes bacterium]|nr:AraC family transcriptional regulator [Planctomycetota bacterium]
MSWLDRISPHINRLWCGPWGPGFVEAARRLYDHELVLFAEGRCTLEMDEKIFPCPAGTWIIVPPNRIHITRGGEQPAYRYCVHFDWVYQGETGNLPVCAYEPAMPAAKKIRRPPDFVPRKIMRGKFPPETVGLMETLAFRWQADAGKRSAARAALLEAIINLLSPPGGGGKRGDRAGTLAFRIKMLLDRMPPMDVSIRRHLETLGYSYEHLCRLFRWKFGLTPVKYLTALRIERAKTFLRAGSHVKEAAAQAGFNDPAYFARVFRRHVGVPPRELD